MPDNRPATHSTDEEWGAAAAQFTRRTFLRRGVVAGGGAIVLGPSLLSAARANASGGGASGGSLTLGVPADIRNFDPYQHLLVNFPIMHTCYDYLADYDLDLNMTLSLAESFEIAADNLSATIVLHDATFHSGAPLTAADVVAGIERAKNPDMSLNMGGVSSFIESAEAVDDRTLTLTMATPTPESVVTDWMYAFPIVEPSANTPEALAAAPGGSGPFMLDSHQPGVSLTLVKNPDYWGEGPLLDGVEFRIFEDQDALAAAVESGGVDGAIYLGSRYAARLEGAGFTVIPGSPAALIDQFYMNPRIPPFDSPGVRQALARAIDRDRIANEIRFGVASPAYNALPPTSPGFDASYLDTYGYDLEEAQRLLDESGGGRSATATVQPAADLLQVMQVIQADLAKIGFELTIEPVDQTTYQAAFTGGELACNLAATSNASRSPAAIANASPFRSDPGNIILQDQVPPGWVEAIDLARGALTPEDEQAAYERINEVLAEEMWAVGVATRPNVYALDTSVTGFASDSGDHLSLDATSVS